MKLYTFCNGEVSNGIIMVRKSDGAYSFAIGSDPKNQIFMPNLKGYEPVWERYDEEDKMRRAKYGILAKIRTENKFGENHSPSERMVITVANGKEEQEGFLIGVSCMGSMSLTDFGSLTTIKGNPVVVMQGRASNSLGLRRFNEYLVIAKSGDIMRASLSGDGGTYIIEVNFDTVTATPIEKCINVSSQVRLNLGTVMARFTLDGET